MRKAIAEYGDTFDALGSIPLLGTALASLAKTGAKLASDKLNTGTSRKGIQEQKKVVERLLRDFDKKLLIIIDDIDRLNNEQIRQVFQLVTAVATLLYQHVRQSMQNASFQEPPGRPLRHLLPPLRRGK